VRGELGRHLQQVGGAPAADVRLGAGRCGWVWFGLGAGSLGGGRGRIGSVKVLFFGEQQLPMRLRAVFDTDSPRQHTHPWPEQPPTWMRQLWPRCDLLLLQGGGKGRRDRHRFEREACRRGCASCAPAVEPHCELLIRTAVHRVRWRSVTSKAVTPCWRC